MSAITLTERELALVEEAGMLLTAPLEEADVTAWRRDANRALKRLLEADRAIFVLPGCDPPIYSEDYSDEALGEYVGYYRSMDVGWQRVLGREATSRVYCKRQLFATPLTPSEEATYAEYSTDFLHPLRVHDAVGLLAPVPELGPRAASSIVIHHDRFSASPESERRLRLLRLVLPAFRAGISMWRRLAGARERFGALLDELDDPVALFGPDGEECYRNRALRDLLASSRAAEELEARIRSAIAPVRGTGVGGVRGGGPGGDPPAAGPVATLSSRFLAGDVPYDLRTIVVNRPLGLGRDTIVVSLRPARSAPPAAAIREAFGLTPRQAEVARLLWDRKTNEEIAEALIISPHTARHHTERVREKLGVESRLEVREVLEGAVG